MKDFNTEEIQQTQQKTKSNYWSLVLKDVEDYCSIPRRYYHFKTLDELVSCVNEYKLTDKIVAILPITTPQTIESFKAETIQMI